MDERGFECTCLACQSDFTAELPRVFCSDACGSDHRAKAGALLVQHYIDHPDAPMPGDRVRLKTAEDRALERDVTADLSRL